MKQAVIFGADYKGYAVEKTAGSDDGYLEINVPRHGAATMVVLTGDFARLRSLRKWEKFSEKRLK